MTTAQEYQIHSRGMLHETEFNTGEIGRPWCNNSLGGGDRTNVPVFEWPANSKTIVNGISYDGQHNIFGAGLYLGANKKGQSGKDLRIYSFCGGIGSDTPEVAINKWSFPMFINKAENYPILSGGLLNINYNPDEAEEIITAKWATNLGVTVTRTSRAWSYPDYDDMIIYEYELVYTGDCNGDGVIEQTDTLVDFMTCFNYGFGPSMYGYQRWYQTWKYAGGTYSGEQDTYWDSDYWLAYNMNDRTGTDVNLAYKPEPDPILFQQFSSTGQNGGGLCSPQAPGYCMLYYPLNHLAVVDTAKNSTINESDYSLLLTRTYELDAAGHVKQPFSNKVTTGVTSSAKLIAGDWLSPYGSARWSGVYSANFSFSNPLFDPQAWAGRGKYNRGQSMQATSKLFVTGPYTLKLGDTLRYALAEVCGYGAQAGKMIQGGQTAVDWYANPTTDRKVVLNGVTMTEHYLTDYGYPDYVNSKRVNGIPEVANVQQVAHKAFTAYLGQEPTLPTWPETNPEKGSYKIPVPCPAPAIVVSLTQTEDIKIGWNRVAENFYHPRMIGTLKSYYVYKSSSAMGPWTLLAAIPVGLVTDNNQYAVGYSGTAINYGDSIYFAVTSVDDKGNESGKTNITKYVKAIPQAITETTPAVNSFKLYPVYPNPSNPGTTVRFNISNEKSGEATVRLFVYDINGRMMANPVNAKYTAGIHEVYLSNKGLASGIYEVILMANNQMQKTKMVVLK